MECADVDPSYGFFKLTEPRESVKHRPIATEDSGELGPAVESLGAARAITQLDPKLLAVLTEAYYIEPGDDDDGWGSGGLHDDGIRDHDSSDLPIMPGTLR